MSREGEYQQRVRSESEIIETKLYNLEKFMAKPEFNPDLNAEHALLVEQHKYMNGYLDVLERRMVLWKEQFVREDLIL